MYRIVRSFDMQSYANLSIHHHHRRRRRPWRPPARTMVSSMGQLAHVRLASVVRLVPSQAAEGPSSKEQAGHSLLFPAGPTLSSTLQQQVALVKMVGRVLAVTSARPPTLARTAYRSQERNFRQALPLVLFRVL